MPSSSRESFFLRLFIHFPSSELTSPPSIARYFKTQALGSGYACTARTSVVEGGWKNGGLGVNTWRKQPDVGVDRGEVLVLKGAFYETHWDCHSDLFSLTLSLLFVVSSSVSLLRMLLKIMKHVIKWLALFNHSNLVSRHTSRFFYWRFASSNWSSAKYLLITAAVYFLRLCGLVFSSMFFLFEIEERSLKIMFY